MQRLGAAATAAGRVYFTGGATALLYGWRPMTVDVDVKIVPERDELLWAVAALKDELDINVELASPDGFIPVRAGWEGRSPFVARAGALDFHHLDLAAQALAKIERGHTQDVEDVSAMLARGLVTADGLRSTFAAIEPELYRYPAVDPASFRRALERTLG